MNVDKDDRTQTAAQFKKELTGETKAVLIKLKSRKGVYPKWFKVASGFAAAIVVLLVVSVSALIVAASSNEVATPEIINHMTDDAEQILKDKELEYMIVDSKVSDKVLENKVMFQEPEDYSNLKTLLLSLVIRSLFFSNHQHGNRKSQCPQFYRYDEKRSPS